ncbi:MAG: hypothetical protein ACOVLI_00695, partial [Rhabdaerophilum sp.]
MSLLLGILPGNLLTCRKRYRGRNQTKIVRVCRSDIRKLMIGLTERTLLRSFVAVLRCGSLSAAARAEPDLVPVLADRAAIDLECWLAVHEHQKDASAIRALFDGLADGLSRWIAASAGPDGDRQSIFRPGGYRLVEENAIKQSGMRA